MDSHDNFSESSYQSLLSSPYPFDKPNMVEEAQVGVWSSHETTIPPSGSKRSKNKKSSVGDSTKIHGPTFCNDEDISLSKAWSDASEDPLTDTLDVKDLLQNLSDLNEQTSIRIEKKNEILTRHLALDEERWAYEKQQIEFTRMQNLLGLDTSRMDPIQLKMHRRIQEQTFKNLGFD